jgi:4'-phosphopantetheinyl transferase
MTTGPDIAVVRGRIAELARTPLLAPDEERRAERMLPVAAASFVAGRTLLRQLLGRWLERDPRPIRITDDPDAKPRLDRDDADLDFNVAHAGDFVLVAVARGRAIGVDVEHVSRRRRVTAIAEAALGPDAAYELRMLPLARRAARFTCWWVRIEAVCKATGAGLTFPVDDSIPPGFTVRDVAMPAGYRAAVAWSAA